MSETAKDDKNFLQRHWWKFLLGIILLGVIATIIYFAVTSSRPTTIQTQTPDNTLMFPTKPEVDPETVPPNQPEQPDTIIPVGGQPTTEQPNTGVPTSPSGTRVDPPFSTQTTSPEQAQQSYRVSDNPTSSNIDGVVYFHQPRAVPMPEYEFNNNYRQRMLDAHNYYRERHCVRPMTWDPKLEQLAQAWGEQLTKTDFRTLGRDIISHPTEGRESLTYLSLDGKNANVGQNLAYGGDSLGAGNIQFRKEPEDVVADWYEEMEIGNFQGGGMGFDGSKITFTPTLEEKKDFASQKVKQYISRNNLSNRCSSGIRYKFNEPYQCSPATGHFTQVVWKDSDKLGCANVPVEWEDGSSITVCNYGPGGNVMSDNEYRTNVIDPRACGNE